MKSRLAVSILFTLLAATCIPNAVIAVGKLRSRTGKILSCAAVHMTKRVPLGQKSGGMTALPTFSPDRAATEFDSLRATNLPGFHDKDLEFLATANRVREILDLIHSK
jgi:hypothetical protein